MTKHAPRPAPKVSELAPDVQDLSGQGVPWPELPRGAPDELIKNSVYVRDPSRVLILRDYDRRRSFQALIQRYTLQLIYGCQEPNCTTRNCFSYRKRTSPGPARRLTEVSARTLACHLATRADPEAALCPHPPVVIKEGDRVISSSKVIADFQKRVLSKKSLRTRADASSTRDPKLSLGEPVNPPPKHTDTAQFVSRPGSSSVVPTGEGDRDDQGPDVTIGSPDEDKSGAEGNTRKHTKKDPKSFTQNLFDAAPLVYLEWLPVPGTPTSFESAPAGLASLTEPFTNPKTHYKSRSFPSTSKSHKLQPLATYRSEAKSEHQLKDGSPAASKVQHQQKANGRPQAPDRRPHSAEFSRRITTAQVPPPLALELTRPGRQHGEHKGRRYSATGPKLGYDISVSSNLQRSIADPATRSASSSSNPMDVEGLGNEPQDRELPDDVVPPVQSIGALGLEGNASKSSRQNANIDVDSSQPITNARPSFLQLRPAHSLSHFSFELVRLLSAMLGSYDPWNKEIRTAFVEYQRLGRLMSLRKRMCSSHAFRRFRHIQSFLDQSIYYVFSDPEAMLASFEHPASLVESAKICWTSQLNRTFWEFAGNRPLLFGSLWQGLESIFVPPPDLIFPRNLGPRAPSTTRHRADDDEDAGPYTPKASRYLTDAEASHIIIFSVEALVAPFSQYVYSTSLILSKLRYAKKGSWQNESQFRSDQVQEFFVCLDIFADDMALRLATRLVNVIAARLQYAQLSKDRADRLDDSGTSASKAENRLTAGLWAHFAWSNNETMQRTMLIPPKFGEPVNMSVAPYTWSMPAIIVEWMRMVLVNSWDGKIMIVKSSTMGNAITVLKEFYDNRKIIGLQSDSFWMPHFEERLITTEMPLRWHDDSTPANEREFHLLTVPFLFHPLTLVTYFRAINFGLMTRAYEKSLTMMRMIILLSPVDPLRGGEDHLMNRMNIAVSSFLVLEVRRDNLLVDALNQLWRRQRRELHRPLKVKMGEDEGEVGIDHGGVQQEFFRLVLTQALHPSYGLFTIDDTTRMTWFEFRSLEPLYKYELVGLVISLALFNGLTLPLTFPRALYRKLLGLPVTDLEHIQDGWPALAKGLRQLLLWKEGDVADVFVRTYEFTMNGWSGAINIDMQRFDKETPLPVFWGMRDEPKAQAGEACDTKSKAAGKFPELVRGPSNPSDLPGVNNKDVAMVTNENREQYVKDYIFWLTDKSIRPRYEAFARGFFACIDRKSVSLFSPELFQTVVEGSDTVDIAGLRAATRYDDGYHSEHPTILNFWSVVNEYSPQMKRQLLEFVTSSVRVPINGIGSILFVIQRNGPDSERAPTSLTCFGRILLPEYSTREKLKAKLGYAIEHGRGFGVP